MKMIPNSSICKNIIEINKTQFPNHRFSSIFNLKKTKKQKQKQKTNIQTKNPNFIELIYKELQKTSQTE